MTILRPSLSTQTITFIPEYNIENLVLSIRQKGTSIWTDFNLTSTYSNGYMTLLFNYDVLESQNFEIEVKDDTFILFRGNAFATEQNDLQNYKMNKDIIVY